MRWGALLACGAVVAGRIVGAGGAATGQAATATSVWAWGANSADQVGQPSTGSSDDRAPLAVTGSTGSVAVAGGDFHGVALMADGTVRTWGSDAHGQLGDGVPLDRRTQDRSTPFTVCGLTGIVGVGAGSYDTYAVDASGGVWAWGANSDGELGDGTAVDRSAPVRVRGLSGPATQVAAGYTGDADDTHAIALLGDGTVEQWGGSPGASGHPGVAPPAPVPGLSNVVAIAAGVNNLALRKDGTVWAWGGNGDGELGQGDTSTHPTPVEVRGLTAVTAISVGADHDLAVTAPAGMVWAWGNNRFGELGNDPATTGTRSTVPERVMNGSKPLTGATAVAASFESSVAVMSDGTVKAWGGNEGGSLGQPGPRGQALHDRLAHPNPVTVPGVTAATSVAAGPGAFGDLALAPSAATTTGAPTRSPASSGASRATCRHTARHLGLMAAGAHASPAWWLALAGAALSVAVVTTVLVARRRRASDLPRRAPEAVRRR